MRVIERVMSALNLGCTLNELADLYLKYSGIHKNTRKSHGYHARHFLRLFGNRQASSLTAKELSEFIESQKEKGLAGTTIRLRVMIWKAVLRYGYETGRISINPGSKFKIAKPKSKRISPPTQEELKRMLDVSPDHLKRVILLGYYLGARIGPSELFRLTWNDVDFSEKIIYMPTAYKTGGNDHRPVPVHDDLIPDLLRWKQIDKDCPWVINYKFRKINTVRHTWHRSRKLAGIERIITPYSLRHAFPTYALCNNADLGAICAIMGHTSSRMVLEVYQHVQPIQLKKAVLALPSIK